VDSFKPKPQNQKLNAFMSLCMSWIVSNQNHKIKNSTNICHYVYMYVLTTEGNPRIYVSTKIGIHEVSSQYQRNTWK